MQPSNIVGTDLLRVRLSLEDRRLLQIDDLSDACSRGESSTKISKIIHEIKSNTSSNENSSTANVDSFHRTALHYAAMKGRASVCKLLLNNGFDANQDDIHGLYPLHLAIQCNHYDAAIELCRASRPNLVNYKRESAVIILSKQRYHPKMKKLLSELIAQGNSINLQDCRKCAPLFYAVDKPSLVSQLIEYGANIHHRDDFGRNALFNAVYATNEKVVQLLIDAGSDLETMDDFSHTPLMLAACFGGIEVVKLLIENGANVNATMKSNAWLMSPLSFAIKHQNYDIAKLMVDYGADMDIIVGDNETIWDLGFTVDHNDNDIEMIDIGDDMDLEIYSMGNAAELNSDATLDSRRTSWARVEYKLKSKRRNSLFEYMQKIETERKMKSIIETELVKKLNVPKDILHLIASPMKWY